MSASLWLPPLVRALATALLVVSASAAAEAAGPFWGALIASLPVSAGPAYVFLAIRNGDAFVAESALSSFAANAATGVFLIVYAVLARNTPRWRGLAAAIAMWVAACAVLRTVAWIPSTAFLLNLGVYGAGIVLANGIRRRRPEPRFDRPAPLARHGRFELPARALAVAAFVSLVVAVSSVLGPEATGIAAVFPVSLISLIVIVRPRLGGAGTAHLAAGALPPMLGFGLALLTLHVLARPFGAAAALTGGLMVSSLWTAVLLTLRRSSRLTGRYWFRPS